MTTVTILATIALIAISIITIFRELKLRDTIQMLENRVKDSEAKVERTEAVNISFAKKLGEATVVLEKLVAEAKERKEQLTWMLNEVTSHTTVVGEEE